MQNVGFSATFGAMRIIAGEFRGRSLLAPSSDATRPVTDRVKQSIFDILSPLIEGANVFDCFAGTGSMGLECLSRGAASVAFFEADESAGRLLHQNIKALRVADRSHVIAGDLFKWFARAKSTVQRADLIFLDPPYRFLRERAADLQALSTSIVRDHLAADGIVIFRHDAADALHLPALVVAEARDYGGMRVEFLRNANINAPPPVS